MQLPARPAPPENRQHWKLPAASNSKKSFTRPNSYASAALPLGWSTAGPYHYLGIGPIILGDNGGPRLGYSGPASSVCSGEWLIAWLIDALLSQCYDAIPPGKIMSKSLLGAVHAALIFGRRARVLSAAVCDLLPRDATVLDVGTGNGTIAYSWSERRPDLKVEGIDILVRPETKILVRVFDGHTIPHDDHSFDVVSFIDVLHHADDAMQLLSEARRVSRNWVLVKDHFAESTLDHATLALMDWVGNAPHRVALPYNYWSRDRWKNAFRATGLHEIKIETNIPLYAFPLNWVFGGGLHFLSLLTVGRRSVGS